MGKTSYNLRYKAVLPPDFTSGASQDNLTQKELDIVHRGKVVSRKLGKLLYIYTNVKIGKILGGKSLPILPKSGPNEGKQVVILVFMQKIYMISAKYTGFLIKSARVLRKS